ncbi:Rv2175c family DNA-binding protein [Isoptericola variabilis]|uniref:Uncharacterized protein n=1 Tax=Isoptericola variabilis (strain 225) TaxID=743718 RepID=F6FWI3_ISOV2|nr:Rv2175c family DNA-binding protein [Isoptericola variabilis]AEG44557.1 hypothetical protein Isova_1811 [Isoptericola variabilis 225]
MNDTPDRSSEASDTLHALDALVGEWLTLPDVAEATGLDVGKVRRLVNERYLVGVRRGERGTFQVPAAFLVPATAGEAAGPSAATEGAHEVLPTLRGTVLVLADGGFSDVEILRWLFDVEPALGEAPIAALRAGRKSAVRRVAQTLG